MDFKLFPIPDAIYSKLGQLVLLFSHVEWLIANAILIGQIKTDDYENIKDLDFTHTYFETILKLKYSQKLDALKQCGVDVAALRNLGRYRNKLAHGLVLKDANRSSVTLIQSKPNEFPHDLDEATVQKEIDLLSAEGGKVYQFIRDKGFVLPGLTVN